MLIQHKSICRVTVSSYKTILHTQHCYFIAQKHTNSSHNVYTKHKEKTLVNSTFSAFGTRWTETDAP